MEKEAKSKKDDNSNVVMDQLEALNIVPFLGLMNMVEVRYLHMPEVYRTMLAILCDYHPLDQGNIIKTRRYLSVLLAREPELAQCLLNFIDTPEGPSPTSVNPSAGTDEDKTCQQASAQIKEEKSEDSSQRTDTPQQFRSEQWTGLPNPELPVLNRYFLTASTSTLTREQGDHQPNSEVPACSHPPNTVAPRVSSAQPVHAPVVNIFHKDLFSSSKPAVAVTSKVAPCQAAVAAPFMMPGIMTSQMSSAHLPASELASTAMKGGGGGGGGGAKDKDQVMVSSAQVPLCGQTSQMVAKSAELSTRVMDYASGSNIKSNKTCSVAQTQTLLTGADRPNLFPDVTSSTASPAPVSLPQTIATTPSPCPDISTSTSTAASEDRPYTLASNQPYTVASNLPYTVASNLPYTVTSNLPYTVASNLPCTVASNLPYTVASNLPYTVASNLPYTVTSSLHCTPASNFCLSKLLGQPAVSYLPAGHYIENRHSIVGFGGAVNRSATSSEKFPYSSTALSSKMNSASAKLHLLSTQAGKEKSGSVQIGYGKAVASVGSYSPYTSDAALKTSMKVISKGGCRKMITLSKIVPVLKLDALPGKDGPVSTASNDKQIQVGQRQVGKKPKATGKKDQACQMHSKQVENTEENLPTSEDYQKQGSVIQLTESVEHSGESLQSQQDTPPLSASQPKSFPNKKLRAGKQNSSLCVQGQNHNDASAAREKQGAGQGKEPMSTEIQNPQLSSAHDDCKSNSPAGFSDQLGENATVTKSSASQRVQVVALSMNTGSSLSAFPYIQQMILPNGQVSTIAHNMQTPTEQTHGAAASVTKSSAEIGDGQQSKESMKKSITPTALTLKDQLKLSVSVQTPRENCTGSHEPKGKTLSGHVPANQPNSGSKSLMAADAAPTIPARTKIKDLVSSSKTNALTDTTNVGSDVQPTGSVQAKRKRSPSVRRSGTAKSMKPCL